MLDHPIIDVALGLVFFYVVFSLVASAVQEWIASFFGLRSKNLKSGVERLVGSDYAEKIYKHPLIGNLAKDGKLPSYMSAETFSSVLFEVVARDAQDKSRVARTADEVQAVIDKIDDAHPLKRILTALLEDGEDAADKLKLKLAGWFDQGMDRISGWYKRRVKVIVFLIAAVLTVATNASTILIAEELWKNDALRTEIVAKATASAGSGTPPVVDSDSLKEFPVGWPDTMQERSTTWWIKAVLGWFITIAAVSLGAPFWFDLLGKVASLKGSGNSPSRDAGKRRTA